MTGPLLIFGAGGQVGKALCSWCEAAGRPYVAFGRAEGDVTSLDGLTEIAKQYPDGPVINASAYTAVDQAEADPESAFAVNAVGASFLAALFGDRPLIHFSTDYVFDGTARSPYRPDEPTAPLGVYGLSKRVGERAILAAANGTVLRTAWVYSADGGNFLKTMVRVGRERGALNVVNDQYGTPTHAKTIADATFALLDAQIAGKNSAEPGLYHLTSRGETTWHGFAREIFAALRERTGQDVSVHPISTDEYPTPAKRPAYSVLDCSKIDQVEDILRPDWRDLVAETVAAVLENSEGAPR